MRKLLFGLVSLVFVGCVPVQQQTTTVPVKTYSREKKEATVKTMDSQGTAVYASPTIADLNVSTVKVTGTASGSSYQSGNVRSVAVANALDKVNADILIEPQYEAVTSNGQVTITVTGYPATYKNFRKANIK